MAGKKKVKTTEGRTLEKIDRATGSIEIVMVDLFGTDEPDTMEDDLADPLVAIKQNSESLYHEIQDGKHERWFRLAEEWKKKETGEGRTRRVCVHCDCTTTGGHTFCKCPECNDATHFPGYCELLGCQSGFSCCKVTECGR